MQPVAEYLRRRRGRPGREIQFRRLGGRRACALLSALRFFSWFSSWFMCNWCTTLVNVVHHRRNHLHYPVVNVVHHQIWVMVRRFRLRLDAEMEVEQVLIRQLHVAVCSREDGDVAGLGQLLDLINDRTPRQPAVVGKRVVARAALPGVLVVRSASINSTSFCVLVTRCRAAHANASKLMSEPQCQVLARGNRPPGARAAAADLARLLRATPRAAVFSSSGRRRASM